MADKNQNSLWRERINLSKDERTRWEAYVSTTMGFADGKQKMWYDDEGGYHTKQLEDHEIFRTVNLMNSNLGIHISRLTANDPRWHPVASEGQNLSRDEIDAAHAILQDVWEGEPHGDDSFKFLSKLAIRYGFLQGRDLVYIRYDEVLKRPVVERFDMWDVYSDPSSQTLSEKQWLSISLPKGVQWLKRNKLYSENLRELLEADRALAESGIKSQYIQNISGGNARGRETVITHFTFELQDDGTIMHRVVVPTIGAGVDGEEGVLFKKTIAQMDKNKPMKLSDIMDSFAPLETGRFYERPTTFDWIDLQKTINKMYSGVENYIDMFIQGRWVIRDEDVDIPVAGSHGQKIIGTPEDVQAVQLQPLPSTHFEHLQTAIGQLEQISGVHSESLGRLSGGADSGVAIAQLQALDEQNSADAVDNFKMFLGRVALKVLNTASKNWKETRTVYFTDKATQKSRPIKVVGGERKEGVSVPDDVIPLKPFRRIDVEIVIGQFFLASQKREEVRALLEAGWTPGTNPVVDRVVLSSFDIGVGREIVSELEKMQNPDEMIAFGKAAKIADGEDVPVHPDDPHEFLAQFYEERAQELFDEGNQQASEALKAKAEEHLAVLEEQKRAEEGEQQVAGGLEGREPPAEPPLGEEVPPDVVGQPPEGVV